MHRNSIDNNTELYGLFGNPIKHSKSPIMINRAFNEAGLNSVYIAFQILPHQLKNAINSIRSLNIRGVNITIPYKEEVIELIDEIDDNAKMIGAVNTIVNDNGTLIGYNTDGLGYVRSLKEETGIKIQGKKIIILGAGGAARGVAYALAREGADTIWIANRTEEKAIELARSIDILTTAVGIGYDKVDSIMDRVELIINTTPVGQHPNVDELPIKSSQIGGGMIVSDIIYNPRITKFLSESNKKGAKIHAGLGMLIYQGAYSFEYWTGKQAPIAAMREAVENSLSLENQP